MTESPSSTVILIRSDGMGQADPGLKHRLAKTYFALLGEHDLLPAAICFYTDGVRLACEGSPVLEELRTLEDKGVRLVLCSTCLSYFELTEQVRVGVVGGMADIIDAQWRADKVITL